MDSRSGADDPADAAPTRIIVEGPGGVVAGEGPPGGGGPIRPRTLGSWNDLDRVHDVAPLDDGDQAVLLELHAVLRRHGAQKRFGVTLLHSHFDLDEGEVLVERVDADGRSMSISAEPAESFESVELVATSWRFLGDRLMPLQYCHRPKDSIFHMR